MPSLVTGVSGASPPPSAGPRAARLLGVTAGLLTSAALLPSASLSRVAGHLQVRPTLYALGRVVTGTLATVTATVGLVGFVAAVIVLRRRLPKDDHWVRPVRPVTFWAWLAVISTVALALVLPAGLLLASRGLRETPGPAPAVATAVPTQAVRQPPQSRAPHRSSVLTLGALLLGTAAAATAAMAVRRGAAARRLPLRSGNGSAADDTALVETVEAALSAGASALGAAPDDPRSAIIASYAAMERALAAAGAGRRTADTPDELLSRASAAGLIRSAGAAALTDLFREARYSQHPLSSTAREAARSALSRIRRDLALPR